MLFHERLEPLRGAVFVGVALRALEILEVEIVAPLVDGLLHLKDRKPQDDIDVGGGFDDIAFEQCIEIDLPQRNGGTVADVFPDLALQVGVAAEDAVNRLSPSTGCRDRILMPRRSPSASDWSTPVYRL